MLFMMKIMWTCRVATIFLSRDAVKFTDCLLTTSQQDVSGIKTIRPVSTPPTFGITRIFLQITIDSQESRQISPAKESGPFRVDATKPRR